MDLQFRKRSLPCIKELVSQCKEQELTQEVRLPDGLPDIGRVIGTWGQLLIRGKEWRQNNVGISGGVMAWVLYEPEDGSKCQVVETWIPFSMKMDISGTGQDGSITAIGNVSYQDARTVSARKFMLRMGICMDIQVHAPTDIDLFEPGDLPKHIQLKKSSYPMKLPAEIGEKTFSLEEQIPLPENFTGFNRIIRHSLDPEIVELKVLGGRLVFRGIALVHILYECADEKLCSLDVEVPFSQFTELDHEYEEGADATMYPVISNLEIEMGEENSTVLKASMTGQYIIFGRHMIDVIEDAYSINTDTNLQTQQLELPVILQEESQRICADAEFDIQNGRMVDCDFVFNHSSNRHGDEPMIEGRFYILFYDHEGKLQNAHIKWEHSPVEYLGGSEVKLHATPAGKVCIKDDRIVCVRADIKTIAQCFSMQGINMITGIESFEKEGNKKKPNLILQKAGDEDIWSIAKHNDSSVEAICSANNISGDVDFDRILIIPVL